MKLTQCNPMTAENRILLVDDDPGLLRLLSMRLKASGFGVEAVASAEQALASFTANPPQLIVTDLRMQGMDGLTLFETVHQRSPTLPVIILTAHGTIPDAVEATQRGVFGYLTKPFDTQQLLGAVNRALRVTGESGSPGAPALSNPAWRADIVTRSPIMEEILGQARLVADGDTSVLIQCASGTGKELLAQAIHRASPRRDGPFVAVNCTAIPEQLLESELFGHQKGAFTGATQNHKGLFPAASGGTLFLDEIGDMPLSVQAKMLRVLQEGEVRPVGSIQPVRVDVRIISATHSDLEQMIAEGTFRQDLYYRLNVVLLELPTLAERREDIPLLASHFLEELCTRSRKRARSFSPEAMEALISASWPGNVRQLRNVVEQSVALSPTPIIPVQLVLRALRNEPEHIPTLADARDQFEREYLVRILRMSEGNVSQAARLAGRNRTEFYKLLQRHHLTPGAFRNND
jgi:two-component system response regulator GlrR